VTVEASKANMRRYEGKGVIAWSPGTYEEFSADPGDYWDMPDDWVMVDAEQQAMVLVVRVTQLVDADVLHPDV
jgi:hypothetical protein